MRLLFAALVAVVLLLETCHCKRGKGKNSLFQSENKNGNDEETSMQARVFSLFSIVTFQNQGCATNLGASGSGAIRNGTCYTVTECQSKGGSAQGNCAAGFGVCCFFSITLAGTLRENCTYVRNPGFPSGSSESTSITYTVSKISSEVCDLRLDFETFNIRGPTGTPETNACRDTFVVTTTSGLTTPTICGLNTGEHIYVDLGNSVTDTATLTFTFQATTGDTRLWEIKATQIICSAEYRPPSGCLQFHTTLTGRLTTFNFNQLSSAAYNHLQNQEYSICIRPAEGYCCVLYQVCSDPSSYTLSAEDTAEAKIGTNCATDWLEIAGGSATCNTMPIGNMNTRFCGFKFSIADLGDQDHPVCDCSAPFNVFIKTDTTNDGNDILSRGLCLEYLQVPCAA